VVPAFAPAASGAKSAAGIGLVNVAFDQ
jgi:hypothetical protein